MPGLLAGSFVNRRDINIDGNDFIVIFCLALPVVGTGRYGEEGRQFI
jgi:hypothetical protein